MIYEIEFTEWQALKELSRDRQWADMNTILDPLLLKGRLLAMSNLWGIEMHPISLAPMCILAISWVPARAVQAPIPHVQRLMDAETVERVAHPSSSSSVDSWWLWDWAMSWAYQLRNLNITSLKDKQNRFPWSTGHIPERTKRITIICCKSSSNYNKNPSIVQWPQHAHP